MSEDSTSQPLEVTQLDAGWTSATVFTARAHSPSLGYQWEFDGVWQGTAVYLAAARVLPEPGGLLSVETAKLACEHFSRDLTTAIADVVVPPGGQWTDVARQTWEDIKSAKLTWGDLAQRSPAEARRRAQSAVRRRQHNREFLAEVAKTNAEGGVAAVQLRFPSSERNVRRWLAAARKEGLR